MAFELAQHVGQAKLALAALVDFAGGELVPAEQEAHELLPAAPAGFGAQLSRVRGGDGASRRRFATTGRSGGGERRRAITAASASSCSRRQRPSRSPAGAGQAPRR
jgi:hypothetical protein